MRVQFCSDLHLEKNKHLDFNELLVPAAPVLALLGDIGDPESAELRNFVTWCCRTWSQVLYVPGNHEFWRMKPGSTKTIDSAMKILKGLEKVHSNFVVMWRTKLISEDGVIILGTPLWSRPAEGVVPSDSEQAWVDRDRTFDGATLAALHTEDLKWIQRELRSASKAKKPVVVLTHYAPSMLLVDSAYLNSPRVSLYASDLDSLLRPPVVAWACGHVHQAIQWMKGWETSTGESGSVLLVTNPRGYAGEESGWRTDAVLRIDPSQFTNQDDAEYLSGMTYKIL
jgi:hypothetical protein